jgi:hypothetical protein
MVTASWPCLITTGKNMEQLTEAYLTPNFLAAHIIAEAPSYRNLQKLTVAQIKPTLHIWDNQTTCLTTLKWELADSIGNESLRVGFEDVDFLIRVVEATCPALINFDIVIRPPSRTKWPDISPLSLNMSTVDFESTCRLHPISSLKSLRHFGQYYDPVPSELPLPIDFTPKFHRFVEKHCSTLRSVVVAVGLDGSYISLNPALQTCRLLPRLQELSVAVKSRYGRSDSYVMAEVEHSFPRFLRFLSTSNRSLQRLSISNIGSIFDGTVGALFQCLGRLKSLRVGDFNSNIPTYNHLGPRHPGPLLDFKGYRPVIAARCLYNG